MVYKDLKNKKGFALTQVMLALALGTVITVGTIAYFIETNKNEVNNKVVGTILAQTNDTTNNNGVTVNTSSKNYKISSVNGISTVSSPDCQRIMLSLKGKGNVSSCVNNTLTFKNNNIVVNAVEANSLTAGTPDSSPENNLTPVNLGGTLIVSNAGTVAAGNGNGVFTSGNGTLAGGSLSSGNNGSLGTGGSNASGIVTPPPIYTGTGTITSPPPAFPTTKIYAYTVGWARFPGPTNAASVSFVYYMDGTLMIVPQSSTGISSKPYTGTWLPNGWTIAESQIQMIWAVSIRDDRPAEQSNSATTYTSFNKSQFASLSGSIPAAVGRGMGSDGTLTVNLKNTSTGQIITNIFTVSVDAASGD